ncbi:trna-aminoacylation cofactor arc1 [Acrodontium crateriforme]|uniref:Trna-aminoacylation cofactor arc1 n=1 Tax=Acrodontium crateriforme TaxID=150365 RepID=A0AAQ3MAY5_9PEZI|nr:trna-aminoacylation cofactor arc1 [Acrodontium crateriforme]
MASTGLENGLKSLKLIQDSYPKARDAEEDPVKLSSAIFSPIEFTDADKTEIAQWLKTASNPSADLPALNTHLSSRTTILGTKPSVADIALYSQLAPVAKEWTEEQKTGEQGYHHVVRWLDFVQNAPLFGLNVPEADKLVVDPSKVIFFPKPIDRKAEKERQKKEKAAALAAAGGASAAGAAAKEAPAKQEKSNEGGDKSAEAAATAGFKTEKKEKKPKQPKPQKNAPAAEKPLSPTMIDLRVGHIIKAIKHPEADSLFVSTIDVGDKPGTDNTSEYEGKTVRTVCSGLNGLVPLEEMQGRKIVAVCNLKPVKMRGIVSAAMVLAASPRLAPGEVDNHAGPVELVNVPADAEAGERVFFEGYEGEPEGILNPKKKVWDYCQVGFLTTTNKEVGFDADAVEQLKDSGKTGVALLKTKQGSCTVKSLTGAIVR